MANNVRASATRTSTWDNDCQSSKAHYRTTDQINLGVQVLPHHMPIESFKRCDDLIPAQVFHNYIMRQYASGNNW